MRHSFFHEEKKMFLSYFEWNEAMEGSVFYILYQYIYPTSDLPQTRRDPQFWNSNASFLGGSLGQIRFINVIFIYWNVPLYFYFLYVTI